MEAATTTAPTKGAESTSGPSAFEKQVSEAQADHDAGQTKSLIVTDIHQDDDQEDEGNPL